MNLWMLLPASQPSQLRQLGVSCPCEDQNTGWKRTYPCRHPAPSCQSLMNQPQALVVETLIGTGKHHLDQAQTNASALRRWDDAGLLGRNCSSELDRSWAFCEID